MNSSSSGQGGGCTSPNPNAIGQGASPMDSPTSSVYSNDGDGDKKQQQHLSSGSNISYTCKKCSSVFQRYYELIRHQKNHCFKEENNKKSAKAQIAAAQIAQQCMTNTVALPGASPSSTASAGGVGVELDMSKSPKSVFPGGAVPSQQHLAAIMAAAAMAVANEKGGAGGDFAGSGMNASLDAVDKDEHMDMVRNLTAILGSVANNQNNDCPPLNLPGGLGGVTTKGGGGGSVQEQYNLSAADLKAAVTEQQQQQSSDQMCNKSFDESYSTTASESTMDNNHHRTDHREDDGE